MPIVVEAGLWGLVAGSGLSLGAMAAVLFSRKLTHSRIATIMGFGGGVLIAIVTVELVAESFRESRSATAVFALLAGGAAFSGINWLLQQRGAKHRKRCGECVRQSSESATPGSGLAIAVGSVLDGIPEALVIGISIAAGGHIGAGLVIGFFLANVPQGLSSAAGMQLAGRSRRYIFSVWTSIPLAIGATAATGAYMFAGPNQASPVILAFAAGSVLAMLAETMIPEAFDHAPPMIGLITVTGFLAALLLVQH